MKIEEALKQKKFETSQEKACINLIYTYNCVMDHITQVFKEFDITHQQYNVLRILRGRNEMVCCAEVKEVMMDKNPDLTRLCDRLVAKGLIERGVNENNRRQVSLRITAKGLDLLDKIDPEVKKNNTLIVNLTDNEAEQLSDLLDKLRG